MKFEELNLSKNLKKALTEGGYEEATLIQEKAIPAVIEGKDLIGLSQTGTGKTAAYSLPIIEKIDPTLNKVQAIILCPTRELALQVTGEIRKFTKYTEGVACLAVYGGESIDRQIKSLKKNVKIVIGTPGRVMDHLRRRTLKMDKVSVVVLDEADEMLNMGFEEDIDTILKDVPEERQTVLFSATMNKRIKGITKKYLKNPIEIKIPSKELTVDRIEQVALRLKQKEKDDVLEKVIEINNPRKSVVFCNTKKKVDGLLEVLKKSGYSAEALHGDIKQVQRERIMKRFKNGEFKILIATDVVARGIDVDELDLVVNYDIPQEEEYYVHRIGRTGRNGAEGKAYTFVSGKEISKLQSIEKYAKTKIKDGKLPTDKEVKEIKDNKMVNDIQNVINQMNEEKNNNQVILERLLEQNDIKQVASALLNMVCYKDVVKEVKIDKSLDDMMDVHGNIKLFLNLGRKDKIMAKDIIRSITQVAPVTGDDIGKVNILDKFSFVEIPGQYTDEVINGLSNKSINGRRVNVEIANS